MKKLLPLLLLANWLVGCSAIPEEQVLSADSMNPQKRYVNLTPDQLRADVIFSCRARILTVTTLEDGSIRCSRVATTQEKWVQIPVWILCNDCSEAEKVEKYIIQEQADATIVVDVLIYFETVRPTGRKFTHNVFKFPTTNTQSAIYFNDVQEVLNLLERDK